VKEASHKSTSTEEPGVVKSRKWKSDWWLAVTRWKQKGCYLMGIDWQDKETFGNLSHTTQKYFMLAVLYFKSLVGNVFLIPHFKNKRKQNG
jgi:hypothetical protein